MARVTWINGIHLAMVFALLATVVARAPGVMLGVEGDTLTYVICTGGDVQTITVPLEKEPGDPEHAVSECTFFGSQIAAIPNLKSAAQRISVGTLIQRSQFISDLQARQPARLSNAVRAPPLGTELS